jgi:hypothetical protein
MVPLLSLVLMFVQWASISSQVIDMVHNTLRTTPWIEIGNFLPPLMILIP